MPKLETMIKNLNEETKDTVLNFIVVCEDLEALIERENTQFFENEVITFDGIFIRKINMLASFEEEIRSVMLLLKEDAPDNLSLRKFLINKIQEVRRALSINTTFQLRDLKKRTQRMAVLKDALLEFSRNNEEEGETVCH